MLSKQPYLKLTFEIYVYDIMPKLLKHYALKISLLLDWFTSTSSEGSFGLDFRQNISKLSNKSNFTSF